MLPVCLSKWTKQFHVRTLKNLFLGNFFFLAVFVSWEECTYSCINFHVLWGHLKTFYIVEIVLLDLFRDRIASSIAFLLLILGSKLFSGIISESCACKFLPVFHLCISFIVIFLPEVIKQFINGNFIIIKISLQLMCNINNISWWCISHIKGGWTATSSTTICDEGVWLLSEITTFSAVNWSRDLSIELTFCGIQWVCSSNCTRGYFSILNHE